MNNDITPEQQKILDKYKNVGLEEGSKNIIKFLV